MTGSRTNLRDSTRRLGALFSGHTLRRVRPANIFLDSSKFLTTLSSVTVKRIMTLSRSLVGIDV